MPFRQLGGEAGVYALLAFDGSGAERGDDADGANGKLSVRILDQLSADPAITDVFLMAHGWNGDIEDAIDQYDRWFGAMAARPADRDAMARRWPRFTPYRIGLHWPSKAWATRSSAERRRSPRSPTPSPPIPSALAGGPASARKLRWSSSRPRGVKAPQLPAEAARAYRSIDRLLVELGAEGEGAAPGSDRQPFDPETCSRRRAARRISGSAATCKDTAPLRALSFWKMKQRASAVGESGAHDFATQLQAAVAGREVRFHLMGHSFGCILVCATIMGPKAGAPLAPVASAALVQGAMSLWSMCETIPTNPGLSGYFRNILADRKVLGATITTRSRFDTANGRFYPIGAGLAQEVAFKAGQLPRYGAVGRLACRSRVASRRYGDARCGQRLCLLRRWRLQSRSQRLHYQGNGLAGAHSDIAGPEVAHATWSAARSS